MDETAKCLRGKSVLSLLEIDYVNELMSHPSIDAGHIEDPYLPIEPVEAMITGDYASDVEVMIGRIWIT